jgi:hypothetical protein
MNFIRSRKSTILLGVLIAASLTIYFSFSLHFFPAFYISKPLVSKAVPVITNVKISASEVSLGKSFNISVTSNNQGDTADIQIVSISFPNLTSIDNNDNVAIKNHNFLQKPEFVKTGDEIGSKYSGLSKVTSAKYPSIEFSSRPWKTDAIYKARIEIKPPAVGKFVIFIKAVSLPHNNEISHYPRTGIKDYQEEFVEAYYVNVKD